MENILTAIEPTFPDTQKQQSQMYQSKNMVIIETSFFTPGECVCDQFHFLIPLRQGPVIRSGNILYKSTQRTVIPCNPQQRHRAEDTEITDFKAFIIYIGKMFFKSMAEELYGNRNIVLQSKSFMFSPRLSELINLFISEYRSGQPGSSLFLESLSVQAAVLLLRESCTNCAKPAYQYTEYRDNKCISKVIDYIYENYRNNISLTDLASETNYSPYHLLRLFKQMTGKTPFEFLLDLKIDMAKNMLLNTDYPMSNICDSCGFGSLSYFSQAFKKKTGFTPTQYRHS